MEIVKDRGRRKKRWRQREKRTTELTEVSRGNGELGGKTDRLRSFASLRMTRCCDKFDDRKKRLA